MTSREPISALRRFATATLTLASALATLHATGQPLYLSEHPDLILSCTQDWGVLGMNTAAHAPEMAGAPIQIGESRFAKGLGHHANGAITLLTDGRYASFDAQVGLQPCSGGSVVFRVIVDGTPQFDSGVLRSGDSPRSVHVPLASALEVRLEAADAGDGISCDMANWAEARLTPAPNLPMLKAAEPTPDMARFARVVTWDPERTEGARAGRIEEFRADDLFTETELEPDRAGRYALPAWGGKLGCIGLQWLNQRALRELVLTYQNPAQVGETQGVRVQGWFRESLWQGNWKSLPGELRREENRMIFQIAPQAGVVQTRKIRWILPAPDPRQFVQLSAATRSRWSLTNLFLQLDRPKAGARGRVTLWNGEWVSEGDSRIPQAEIAWRLTSPLHISVRYSRPSPMNGDPTVLQFRLPTGDVGVAVADVLANDCVYLPDHGLFVAREPLPVTLAVYKRRMAERKTILEEVRALPDQTLAQAMMKTHHAAQSDGPVLLSLACDNAKFIVERDGSVRQVVTTNASIANGETGLEIKPRFGSQNSATESRSLDGEWLPIPILTTVRDGIEYRERSFVAPCDESDPHALQPNHRSVCVVEFTLTNTLRSPAPTLLSLGFADRRPGNVPLKLSTEAQGWIVSSENVALARGAWFARVPLSTTVKEGTLEIAGTLPPLSQGQFTLFLPGQPGTPLDSLHAAQLRDATERYWRNILSPATQIETPDPLLNNLIRSSQVRCLIDARNEADGERVAAWIAAMSYGPLESESHSVIRGMDFLGHSEFARRSLDFFISRYNTNGFLTTGYTTFGTAWHLWALGEHWQLTGDTNWLRQVAPEIARVGHWIVRQTEKTKKLNARGQPLPEFGLMPPGVLADWNAFAYHFAMNAYYTAALGQLGDALAGIGHPDAHDFQTRAAELKTDTLRAYAWTQAQAPALPLRNGTWIPHYPSQVHSPGKLGAFFPGQDAGRSWCYDVEIGAHQLVPTGVLEPHSREVERMMDHMEDVQFLADGWFDYPAATNGADWFNLGGFSKVQPYYTRNCEIDALRDDVKPFVRSYFNTLAAMLNPEVLTFWEHFHHSGAWDKTHETGYFLHQTRTMLVQERANELWLAPFVTDQWLKDGEHISVKQAPTRFGPVAYEIHSHIAQGFIEARIEPPNRLTPRRIVLRLRHPDGRPIRTATANGKHHREFDAQGNTVSLKPGASPIILRVDF